MYESFIRSKLKTTVPFPSFWDMNCNSDFVRSIESCNVTGESNIGLPNLRNLVILCFGTKWVWGGGGVPPDLRLERGFARFLRLEDENKGKQ